MARKRTEPIEARKRSENEINHRYTQYYNTELKHTHIYIRIYTYIRNPLKMRLERLGMRLERVGVRWNTVGTRWNAVALFYSSTRARAKYIIPLSERARA
jgi:hypothetical protein